MMDPATGKYPFVGLTFAAMAGILLADHWPASLGSSMAITAIALGIWRLYRRTPTLLVLVVAIFHLLHSLQFDHNASRMLAAQLGGTETTIHGSGIVDSVPNEIASSTGKLRSNFQVTHAQLTFDDTHRVGSLSLLVNWPDAKPKLGDRIEFEGNLRNVAAPRNPGEFDYRAWLARQNIFSQITVPFAKKAHIVTVGSNSNLRRWANETKLTLARIITTDLTSSPVEASVISAMMLGTKDDTPDSTLELFMKTGTFHLFSVSGLHVTMLAAITFGIFTIVRIPRRTALLLTIPSVFIYALITGWSPSSVRAAMMTSAFVVATLLDRSSLSINTLAVACFLILIANTNQLFSAGFQLSFTVVGAIILLSGTITRWLQTFTQPDPFLPKKLLTPFQKSRWLVTNKIAGNLGLTLSAWAGSLPLTAVYFNLLSPVALVANLCIVPLAFLILTLGILSLMSSLVSSWLVVAFNNTSWAFVKVLLLVLGAFAAIPGSSAFVGSHWWQRPSQQRVTFFDLGSGGATAIETSNSCWLVDCGSDTDYRRVVRHYLQQRGINRVDGILLTHGDGSHIGGITQFLIDFPKAAVYVPEAGRKSIVFRRLVNKDTAHWITAGANFSVDDHVSIDVLWPPSTVDSGRADDHCMVLKLSINNQMFLLTGDSGLTTEMNLLANESPDFLRADWLVMGRDRNDVGGSKTFFQRVGARSVLTTGTNFPPAEKVPASWVKNCRELGLNFLRFDETGAVQIDLQEKKVDVKTFARAGEVTSSDAVVPPRSISR
ncbi:MAG: ComEC/Rec2 family competence protein [Chthoniobacterales bacterium]